MIISSIILLVDSLLLLIYKTKALEKAKKFNSLVVFKGYLVKIAMICRTSSSLETTKVDASFEVKTSPPVPTPAVGYVKEEYHPHVDEFRI